MGNISKAKSGKRKTVKTVILFIVLIFTCIVVLFCLNFIKKSKVNYEDTISVPDSFSKISQNVIDVISENQEEFMSASLDERREIAEKIMDELVAQGALKEENIGFDSDNNIFQFVTNDGVLNMISLNDFDMGYMGAIDEKTDSDNESEEEDGSGDEGEGKFLYFQNGYPYSDEELMAENLDMLFFTEIYKDPGKEYDDYHNFYESNIFQLCSQAHVQYRDIPQTTVKELRTCLKGHDFISMDFHGLTYKELILEKQVLNSIIPGLVNTVSVDFFC